METRYTVNWDNGHDCGTLPEVFTTKRDAAKAGREWKRGKVNDECTAYDRKVMREALTFEVVPEGEAIEPPGTYEKPDAFLRPAMPAFTYRQEKTDEYPTCPHCSQPLTYAEIKKLWGSYCGKRQTPHAGPGRPKKPVTAEVA